MQLNPSLFSQPSDLDMLATNTVALVGVPTDENSSYLRGAAQGPPKIRQALHSASSNLCSENGLDLSNEPRFADLGDLRLSPGLPALAEITEAIDELLARGISTLALGGDHAITYPIVRSYARHYKPLQILHLDAHPDLYDEFEGNRYSHACPFARIMEQGLATRLVQVGIRGMNPHQQAQAKRFGVEVIDMPKWQDNLDLQFSGPLYLSLDMDVLDPAFAPGVSHQEPGGLSTREVIRLLHSLDVPIVGADLVEMNPSQDVKGMTAMVGGKLVKEIVASMLASQPNRTRR